MFPVGFRIICHWRTPLYDKNLGINKFYTFFIHSISKVNFLCQKGPTKAQPRPNQGLTKARPRTDQMPNLTLTKARPRPDKGQTKARQKPDKGQTTLFSPCPSFCSTSEAMLCHWYLGICCMYSVSHIITPPSFFLEIRVIIKISSHPLYHIKSEQFK